MRKLIRRIVNWAYGTNLEIDLIILFQAKENLATIMRDLALRSYITNPPKKEEEL